MTFQFTNYARELKRRGDRRWFEWKVFMDEPRETLDLVEEVEYRLHPTFPEPIQVIREPPFALRTTGWGVFVIHITIALRDGSEEHAEYSLSFDKPWPGNGSRLRQDTRR